MPFTFSHPAIVLPLKHLNQRWFSLTGLIIGSIVPDFEYFLRMQVKSVYSHSIVGVLYSDLPLAILLAFIFHNIVRNSLLNHLPRVLQSRFTTFKALNWNSYFIRNWWVVLISIIIGSYSHLFWDAFTHTDGYFVKLIPELQNTISFLGIIHIPLFKILQHCSTIIGGIIILYYIYLLPKYDINTKPLQFKYWIIVAIITFLIVLFKLFLGLNIKAYGNLIVTTIASTMLSLVITPLLMKSE